MLPKEYNKLLQLLKVKSMEHGCHGDDFMKVIAIFSNVGDYFGYFRIFQCKNYWYKLTVVKKV